MSYLHKNRSKRIRSKKSKSRTARRSRSKKSKSRTARRSSSKRIRKKVNGECPKTSGCACPGVKCMVKPKCRGKTKCPWSKSKIAKYSKNFSVKE